MISPHSTVFPGAFVQNPFFEPIIDEFGSLRRNLGGYNLDSLKLR